MLLTSWVESMRVAFEKSRKATLNPRRRLQLRSVPSSARQKVQRRIAIEQLEDRTLLTSLIINQLTAGLGLTLNNSVLDPDSDKVSDYDTIIFENLTIDAASGAGVSINLSDLTFTEDFKILFDNVTINASAGVGIDINLSNLLIDTIAIDSSTITGGVGNAFNLNLSNTLGIETTLNEFNIIDSSLSGQSGAGVTVALNASTIEETSLRRSNIDGVSIDVTNGSYLYHTTLADNTISGTSGSDGVNVNIVDSIAEELRLTNNDSIQGVAINVDDTAADGAALLTELFIHTNLITGNTAGDGVRIDLNNVDQFVSISGNTISSNSGHGIVFDQTDGDLSGDISDNVIENNAGHGVFFTPSTTNPLPTGDGAPGVPPYAGIPGATDKIDFAAPRNEVQLITFEGLPTGGTFSISYTGSDGIPVATTMPLNHLSTAAQVKAAMVDAFDEISVSDILVNGNFTDGYEIEFLNAVGGRNINLLTVDPTNLTLDPIVINTYQGAVNDSEIQHVDFAALSQAPIFGYFSISLYGRSRNLEYTTFTTLTPAEIAQVLQDEINILAALEGFTDSPVEVTVNPTSGFDIYFLFDRSLKGTDVPQVNFDDSGLNYGIGVSTTTSGNTNVNERQRLQFQYRDGSFNPFTFDSNPLQLDVDGFITNLPAGATFTLTFDGRTTGAITIVADDPALTATNIENALELIDGNSTDSDFTVTGDFVLGFTVEFIGAHDRENVALMTATTPVLIDLEAFTYLPEGFGQNEIQRIYFPTPPGAGTFTLDFSTSTNGPTIALPYNATAAQVQQELEGLDTINVGDVSVTGSIATGGFFVEFTGQYRVEDTGGVLSIDESGLQAANPTVTTIAEGTSINEVQEIIVEGVPTNGTFNLSFDGEMTTLDFDATNNEIFVALENMSTIGAGNVIVRGDALTGFEVEFIGALATINTPQIIVDDLNLSGAAMIVKTTTVGGYLRGIRGNTITGNSGAGIEVNLEMYTSFFGDITGNTISSNEAVGINLEAADPNTLHSVDFSISVDDNTLDDNQGAGIAVNLQDTATGDVSITNNTITGSRDDNNVSTPYGGDAIYIDLFGTDVSFEAFSQLRDLTIDGNNLGTDADGTTGLGNAGHGIGIHIEEFTIIDQTQISNNLIANNVGDGVNFYRQDDARVGRGIVDPIVGEERAVKIFSNMIAGNSDGVDILAQNGSLTTTDFEIKDNLILSNVLDGIRLHAEADATIFVDIINNQITSNLQNGIESTTRSPSYSTFVPNYDVYQSDSDRRDVAGTWIQNDISLNGHHGIRVSGHTGNRVDLVPHLLFIGLDGVDPVTGIDRGNLIEGNGRDGIQFAAHLDGIGGNVKIANNAIVSNGTGGLEISGERLNSSIDNNLIKLNNGKGVDINSNGQTLFLRNNIITENTSDGLEVLNADIIRFSEYGNNTFFGTFSGETRLTAIGNYIDNNGGRGVDLQTQQRSNSDFIFGDGTTEGANVITSNALEGFYVVTTSSGTQDQDADSTDALAADGAIDFSSADMILQLDTNLIRQNGRDSDFSATGLILRIGTSDSATNYISQLPGSSVSVGNESNNIAANGRSNVSITNNGFEGNFGEDVFIESFTSTVDPATTEDAWEAGANPSFRVLDSYQRDPLAKLNLVFEGNSGNGLSVSNLGAYYDNAEGTFKSRIANGNGAPDPDGPSGRFSATRRRNAQRVASRTNLAPFTSPNIAPTAVGSVADAFLSTPGGPIQITTTTAHGLPFNGVTVEITDVFSDELGGYDSRLSPANGVFVIDIIDAFNFTLRGTEGAVIGDVASGIGTWSYNNTAAFLFDGMGVSTFRIAQGFDGVGNGFQQGDSFLDESNYNFAPFVTYGELNFDWDTWVPEATTFQATAVRTYLTADISVAAPDPTNNASVGDFVISFTEDVSGVDLGDFTLYRNNEFVDLSGAILTQIDARTFTLNIDTIIGTAGDGDYELRLNANGTIFDATYASSNNLSLFGENNFLLFGDIERFTIDTLAPTVDIVEISPNARSAAVGEVVINFDEEVTGVDLSDFSLSRDGEIPVNLASTPATLVQVTGSQFILDLSKVTSLSGSYALTLNATGSSITDLAGNDLENISGQTYADLEEWDNDTSAPIGQFDPVSDPSAIQFSFSEPIVMDSLDITDFSLIDSNGVDIPLTSMNATLSGSSAMDAVANQDFEIDLMGLADVIGSYTLTYHAEDSAVQDDSGNKAAGSVSVTWQNAVEVVAPIAGIQDIDDLESLETVGLVTINFTEVVTGVDITDFKLVRVDGMGTHDVDLEDMFGAPLVVDALNGSTYQIDLTDVTGLDGTYTLTLLSDGSIKDTPLNVFTAEVSETWRIGGAGPVATIQELPDILLTEAGIVTVSFNQAVVNATNIDNYQLTLNGQNVSLDELTVIPISGGTVFGIDLSTVTDVFGTYTFSLVAAGSDILNISGEPVLEDASETWVYSSTIDLNVVAPIYDDLADPDAGDGIVGTFGDPSTLTLRAAIQEANELAGSNIIELAAGAYQLSIDGIDEDQAATGDLDIRDNLTIRGQGVAVYDDEGNLVSGTVIDGGEVDRIFQIFAGITLNLENLTITNGKLTGSADGAGIRNSGTTTLTNVEVTDNHAEDSAGGINNTGLMIIVDSTISANTAGGSGGGIRNTGTLEVTRSTIHGNSTDRDGGAIFNAGAGIATLSNTTFSGNNADRSGGAVRNTATMTATNNTFTLNVSALGTGGGISSTGTSTLQNNLIIGNTGAELDGDFISLGGNLTGLIGTATGIGVSDTVNVLDPTLVLDLNLADNGGPTLTHALILGSAAIDAGVNAIDLDALEQRGSTRILGTNVDVGAVEFGTFFVNSLLDTVDDNVGDGIAADVDGNVTLRAAIMEANALAGDSVIMLGPGTYYLNILNLINSDLDDTTTGDLDITDLTGSLTILGAGDDQTIISAAIDPGDMDAVSGLDDRVFDVLLGVELNLEGLMVTGGTAIDGSGGGIRNVGRLSLVNTVVAGNTAGVNGGGILNGQLGEQGTLNLTNSTVSNNTATYGAGIYNNDQSLVTLIDSEMTGNTASADGGGLFNDLSAVVSLTRSSISGNTAVGDGGGIYNNDLAHLTINDSKVNNNTAQLGAGIFNEEAASLTISRTTVSGNHALLSGGGIYNDEGVVTLNSVSILTNMADSDGGGLYNASAGQITVTNSFFDDNSADRDGGAIANFGISLSITGTTIRDSDAVRNGGALFNDQEEGSVSLVSTTFINNEAAAGGGIYNQELGTINLDLSDINNNIASTNGGGIFSTDDATLNLQRTTVDGNTATNDGAGIYNESNSQLNLFNSTVSNNIATHFGGGLYNNSIAEADIVNATISGNKAANGGGIYNDEEGSMELTNATIFNNTATTGPGGGILNKIDGTVSLANSIVAGNYDGVASPDVDGVIDSSGNNLIGIVGVSSGYITSGIKKDMVGSGPSTAISPGLGALQDNGGATFTHELLGGSLARDAGNNFYAPTDDQRGFARLFDGDGNGSLVVDIGAFESGYIVTAFGDSVDATPGDGVSVDINGQSTLRAAVIEANARFGADTILLGTGTYTLSLFGLGENNALLGDLDITDDLTIIGAGSGQTFIDADSLDRIFHIFAGINVSIRGVTLVNGDVTRAEDGGAILNFGNLTLEDVEIRDSLANRGGALFNNGVVTITDSFFTENVAIADGGAIFNNNGGTVTLSLSTISFNDAENGGGVYNTTTGTLEIVDTTLDRNTASVAGGAVYNSSEEAVGNGEGGGGISIPDTDPDPDPDPDPTPLYSIEVVFIDSSLTASQQAIFQEAAARWSEIIIADIPDVFITGIGLVDDLRIEASAPFIDGVNGILGQAGPELVRTGTFIPATGTMEFDSADVAALEASGQLFDVILHEMGHVIGIGTIWSALGLVVGLDTADPRFIGTTATAQYNTLLGRSVADVPVANAGTLGDGSFGGHWRESDLDNELMTPIYNSGVTNPISVITIGSLADLGYVVDLSVADTYPLQASVVQPLNLVPIGQMLSAGAFTVLDASSLVAVEAGAGTVTISNSTISNNFAGTRGGGLLNEDPIEISNVTFSGNEAGKEGGAIHNTGDLTINNTTIYNNETEGSGGGVYSVADTASVNIRNTILAGNRALVSGADVLGVFTSQGHNLIGTQSGSVGFIDGFNNDFVGSEAQRLDPVLSPLEDHGGPTLTHALLAGSLAIDAGDNTDGVVIDQRGATRPTDTTSDIGAFEIVTPSVSITESHSQIETDAGTATVFEIVVSLSNTNVDVVTVDYETSNGTAEAGIDYNYTTGTVTFAAGETTQIIEVIVIGDDDLEDHETFYVDIFNSGGATIDNARSTVTIQNDEAIVEIEDFEFAEGDAGETTEFEFKVTLSGRLTDTVTVDVATLLAAVTGDFDADSDDFASLDLNQQVIFAPNDTEKIVTIVVNGDFEIENDETFEVALTGLTVDGDAAVTIGAASIAEGKILNDDFSLLSINDVTTVEPDTGTRDMTFTVSLSQTLDSDLVFDVYTMAGAGAGAATSGTDFVGIPMVTPETVTIFAGNLTATFTVTINADLVDEDNEFFYAMIDQSTVIDATVVDDQGVGTIIDQGEGLLVTTTSDDVDSADGVLSLREAIDIINDDTAGQYHTIVLPSGVYEVMGTGDNENERGDFDIQRSVRIVGDGANLTTIDADGLDRIFHTAFGVDLELSGMQLINGHADDGGAIYAQGELELGQVTFENNTANFLGGAIYSIGHLDISDAQFLNNHAGFQGGAVYQYQDTAMIARSTFTDNSSGGRAGALYVASGVIDFDITDSLFSNNDSGSRGGAIYSEGIVSVSTTTFTENHAVSRGGAIFNAGTFDLSQSTLYLNTADQSGGGIYNEGIASAYNSTFSENHAVGRGGAIFNMGAFNLLNDTLTLNTANQYGGGIFNDSAATPTAVVNMVNTLIAGNSGLLADDDLSGAYNVDELSFNNLIGNIGSATGLVNGDNANLVGSFAAPIDPKLDVLADNGGPTLTHLLLEGSVAIDAGRNEAVLDGDLDQRGELRSVDGNNDLMATVDIGAVEIPTPPIPVPAPLYGTGGVASIIQEQTNIQITVVTQPTGVSSEGHTYALPANEDWINEWQSFWVEVWVDTASGYGISDVLTNIAYNTAYFSATSVQFGSSFAFNRSVTIDDEAGLVQNLGGSSIQSDVGGTGYALLARIKFESLEGDQVEVDPTNLTFAPLELGLDVLDTEIDINGVGEVTANVGALPQTDLYPVVYDINDDDSINYRDLMKLAAAYDQEVFSSSLELTAVMDFNKSGRVDFKDLTYLAANYGKSKGGNSQVNFPTNFGQTWIGTSLDVVSGDDSIDQVIEAAVDTWETALGLEEPLEVQVIVRDFDTAQLGSGQTTEYNVDGIPVAGRVVIDNDANGLGWHVDVTDLPSGGGYDLYTVLLHEIGHVLGFTRYYSGFGNLIETETNGDLVFVGSDFTVALDSTGYHIEDSAYPDDLLNDTLDPGIRKTPSDISVQMLLEAYENAQAGSGSGGGTSSPIYGTNSSVDSVADPVVIQSTEAAQVFIDQSTVDFVAPAAIKIDEEDSPLENIRQVATFDAIQPSVFEQAIADDELELDETLFEDLYSSMEFEDGLTGSDSDDRQLVFAHSENELDLDLADDFDSNQELMDEAFTNWEGPLL